MFFYIEVPDKPANKGNLKEMLLFVMYFMPPLYLVYTLQVVIPYTCLCLSWLTMSTTREILSNKLSRALQIYVLLINPLFSGCS